MPSRCFATLAFASLVATSAIAEELNVSVAAYSPWSKLCMDNNCFTGRDGRTDCGPVVGAWLIELNGDTKKTLRVSLPTRVKLEAGVRIIIDRGQAIERMLFGREVELAEKVFGGLTATDMEFINRSEIVNG